MRCLECIPGLYGCPAHLVACGGECFICCNYCLKVLCYAHMYCPCTVARREWVASLPIHQAPVVSPRVHIPVVTSVPMPVSTVLSPTPVPVSAVPSPVSHVIESDWPVRDDWVVFVFLTIPFLTFLNLQTITMTVPSGLRPLSMRVIIFVSRCLGSNLCLLN